MQNTTTPEERSLRARLGAETSWANTTDRSARTSNARSAFEQRFLDEAGGDPIRAAHLRKAYFAGLSLKSATARRKAKQLIAEAEQAESAIAEQAS